MGRRSQRHVRVNQHNVVGFTRRYTALILVPLCRNAHIVAATPDLA